ncbi:MAG TPA: hypothetical protein VK206_28685 [Anaerolineales bacterium]|nr:hypothetical protein [Anaerolineales bacterium]
MAMRAATMNSMHPLDAPTTVRESESLFRKLVLLVLLISAAALWIVVWFNYETIFPLLLSTFFADVSLGLVAGFGSRFILRSRDLFIRYVTAIAVVTIGMFMIGFLTHWILGIGPIRLEQKFAEQVREIRFNRDLWSQIRLLRIGSRVLFDFSKMDWADPVHLAISLVIAILSLHAWRPTTITPITPAIEPVELTPLPVTPASPATPSRRGRRSSSASNGRARVRRTASTSTGLIASPQPRVRSNNGSRPSARSGVKKVKEPTIRPKKKRLSRRKPKIQFALVEEHRCPYCLDAVSRNDPRGVKECEVCHTLHHADCWAITGVCQVPHLNT